MNNKGFTLIEMTVVLLFVPVILSLTLILMGIMKKELPIIISQEDIFQLQIRQLLLRSSNVSYEENKINFMYNQKEFEINIHNNRLVISPGYEILLMNVIEIRNKESCFIIVTESRELCIEK